MVHFCKKAPLVRKVSSEAEDQEVHFARQGICTSQQQNKGSHLPIAPRAR